MSSTIRIVRMRMDMKLQVISINEITSIKVAAIILVIRHENWNESIGKIE